MDKNFVKLNGVYEIDFFQWDDLVQRVYGHKNYEIVADEEASNNEMRRYQVQKRPLSDYEQEVLARFMGGAWPDFITRILLQDLANYDQVPEGVVLINIYN